MARPRKKLTGALAVMAAGERAMRAEQKVSAAEKALEKARKARTDAEAEYMALVRESFSERLQGAPTAPQEVTHQQTA
jgi:hypothetical protein